MPYKVGVRYYHLRLLNESNIDSLTMAGQPAVIAKEDISPLGGATFAWRVLKKHPKHGDKCHVLFSMSRCCPRDHYNKKIGRSIVDARLANKIETETLIFNQVPKNGEVITQLVEHYLAVEDVYQGDLRDYIHVYSV